MRFSSFSEWQSTLLQIFFSPGGDYKVEAVEVSVSASVEYVAASRNLASTQWVGRPHSSLSAFPGQAKFPEASDCVSVDSGVIKVVQVYCSSDEEGVLVLI